MKFKLLDEEGQTLATGDKELNGHDKPRGIMWHNQMYFQHPADHDVYELGDMMIVVDSELTRT